MGSGHGGWLSENFNNRFYTPLLEQFHHLVKLKFHHDCTDHLINLLTQNNSSTLKILDFSYSQNVSDVSAENIAKCYNLQELELVEKSSNKCSGARPRF